MTPKCGMCVCGLCSVGHDGECGRSLVTLSDRNLMLHLAVPSEKTMSFETIIQYPLAKNIILAYAGWLACELAVVALKSAQYLCMGVCVGRTQAEAFYTRYSL